MASAPSSHRDLDSQHDRQPDERVAMENIELLRTLQFLREAERLKDVERTAWTSKGRRESAAEHTWRLSLMALVLEGAFPEVDLDRLLRIIIVHDLGEALTGDISATLQPPEGKSEAERTDLLRLLEPLPEDSRGYILGRWDEYEAAETVEARVVKGLDKLETILQHNQGMNPPDFDYAFNMSYGTIHTSSHPVLRKIREFLDEGTRVRAEGPGR
jgi:putative hydrolases of HD superfamily